MEKETSSATVFTLKLFIQIAVSNTFTTCLYMYSKLYDKMYNSLIYSLNYFDSQEHGVRKNTTLSPSLFSPRKLLGGRTPSPPARPKTNYKRRCLRFVDRVNTRGGWRGLKEEQEARKKGTGRVKKKEGVCVVA